MATYSHSKLSTFDQCKYKYKLRYIDFVKSELKTIEGFMGIIVHQTLEKLYRELKAGIVNSKDNLLKYYLWMWQKNWTSSIVIVKKEYNEEHYKTLGLKYIMDYYDRYSPFNKLTTVGIETNDRLNLKNEDKYYVMIDRLAVDEDKNYYVIDYKTNANPANQATLDKDTQLAMYSLWVKDKFLDAKSIKLVWNFLATDEEKVSVRTDEELVEMKEMIESKIKEIESCIEYPATASNLCDYCEYKSICPEWKGNEVKESKERVEPKYTRQKLLNAYLK